MVGLRIKHVARLVSTILIAASVGGAGATGFASQPRCALGHAEAGEAGSLMSGYVPTFRSGDELPRDGVFALALRPNSQVRFVVGSTRVAGDDDGYGSIVIFPRIPAGRYRLRLSRDADVEAWQNYRRLPLIHVPGEVSAVDVEFDGRSFVLQVRGPAADPLVISILPLLACPPG